jgi:hypothetical protein
LGSTATRFGDESLENALFLFSTAPGDLVRKDQELADEVLVEPSCHLFGLEDVEPVRAA